MSEVLTFGESMMVFAPSQPGLLRYTDSYRAEFAGAESNTAIGLCKLGHTAEWFSRIGDDESGQYILYKIRAEGVQTGNVIIDSLHSTGMMIKEFSPSGETRVYYYRDSSAASFMRPGDLPPQMLEGVKILHLTGITPVLSNDCRDTSEHAVKAAAAKGVKVSFDPNIRKKLWKNDDHTDLIISFIKQSNIVSIGLDEAGMLFKTTDFKEIEDILFGFAGMEYLAVKNGAEGAYVSDGASSCLIPPYPCSCIDSTGAGDAFNAAFLAGILEKRPVDECGKMGAIAGALCTQSAGDTNGTPTRQELHNIMYSKQIIYR